MIHFSSPNYKSVIFSKNHVSGNARKIGVTFIWWFTFGYVVFKADAVLVYFKEVLKFWCVNEKVARKCFETRNTVEVKQIDNVGKEKDTILFVGTLYKEKKVDVLIQAYKFKVFN